MIEINHSEDPYVPDRLYENNALAITRKNARFIEAVVALDSNYGKDAEYNAPDPEFEPEQKASNAEGMYCGSTVYWFDEMQKKGSDFRKCVLGAVIAIDTINSTHLEACENGRKTMRDRICSLCRDCEELKEKLTEEFDPLNRQGLIYVLSESMKVKQKDANRKNISFATKFCSYAALYLHTGIEYSKYDDIVSRALPTYAKHYLNKDFTKYYFKPNPEKEKGLTDAEKLHNRLVIYKEYSDTIKEILAVVSKEKVSIDEFDHIVWYGLKGK